MKKFQAIRIIIASFTLIDIVITTLILKQKNAINIYDTKMVYVWFFKFQVTLEWHITDKLLTHSFVGTVTGTNALYV